MITLDAALRFLTHDNRPDSELAKAAQALEAEASGKETWSEAKKCLVKAKRLYGKLRKPTSEHYLRNGRHALELTSLCDSYNIWNALNYVKRIFVREDSEVDLRNLGARAEHLGYNSKCFHDQMDFLEYARDLFLYIWATESVRRIGGYAWDKSLETTDLWTRGEYLDLAISCYKGIGEHDIVGSLREASNKLNADLWAHVVSESAWLDTI